MEAGAPAAFIGLYADGAGVFAGSGGDGGAAADEMGFCLLAIPAGYLFSGGFGGSGRMGDDQLISTDLNATAALLQL